MSKGDKTIICRVCLRSDIKIRKKCISLFERHKDALICDNISSIANVVIKQNDGLPSEICPDCLLELDTAVTFKAKCENSNIILLGTLPGNQITQLTEFSIDMKLEQIKKEEPDDYVDDKDFEVEYLDTDVDFGLDLDQIGKQETQVETLNVKPNKETQFECHDCGEFFKSKCKLKVHWKRVHLLDKLVCETCKRAFKSTKAYVRHVKSNNRSCLIAKKVTVEGIGKQRVFHCKDCAYKSRRIKDIQTHLVTHNGDRPFQCDLCQKRFTQQGSLQSHKETTHKLYLKEITCQYCGKFLRGRNRIYLHLKTHTDKQVQCDICKKVLSNKKILVNHLQRHTGVKMFTCETCASPFYTLSDLCNHRRTIHQKGQHIYKCEICGYTTYRSETLKKHKARHTADRIPCLVCGMFVANADELLQHQKRHLFKKYECPYCQLKYARRDSRNKHVRAKHNFLFSNMNNFIVKKEKPPMNPSDENEKVFIEVDVAPILTTIKSGYKMTSEK
ncbi:telomere zinc finger-associated protein-like isoform X2 [Ostrinia furnacalis]|uniref:telomere zinc finger-associated protein-like isoform X1 n=1 Tax=Ostrinia furnacalis TaxID=93504 RepID=UPI00103A363F|nr:telomere zinc finger-associated protein-like isoform X1 [Ostrinia furnacalis]XP_028171074.1 telomere zinc finger-associated protein-like isoform X2 [Ostrinia furnacalis]